MAKMGAILDPAGIKPLRRRQVIAKGDLKYALTRHDACVAEVEHGEVFEVETELNIGGHLITHIDGEPVQDGRLTMLRIALLRPGDSVNIAIQRNQQSLELRAIVGVLSQSGNQLIN